MQNIKAVLEQYAELGFDTLPLEPGTKKARLNNWPRLDPAQMWQDAPKNANVGIRGGGAAHLAVIDCDDKEQPGTYQNFLNWFDGLGYPVDELAVVQTASIISRHIYVTCDGPLFGHSRNISESFGAGEFRYGPGAYVVAPPSKVDSHSYSLLTSDFNHLPTLSLSDIRQFVNVEAKAPVTQSKQPTWKIPKRTLALLNSEGIQRYSSRSNADQAILTGFANAGIGFDSVLQAFSTYPGTGKFQELQTISNQRALGYLRRSFDNAVKFASSQESRPRQLATKAKEWAMSRPWPGKTGLYDKAVFIAHSTIAYQASRYEYGASARELALLTALSPEACMNATERLCEAGFITLVRDWVADCSNTYRIESQSLTLPHRG